MFGETMTKIIIDSFDTEEQAVAFVNWFKKQSQLGRCNILTIDGGLAVDFDGVDLNQTNKEQIVFNVSIYNLEEDEGF